jgi:hypothetical protein
VTTLYDDVAHREYVSLSRSQTISWTIV